MFVNAARRAARSARPVARSFASAARPAAAAAGAPSIKGLALGGITLAAAGVAAFAAVDARPAMCAAPVSAERTYIMIKPDGVQRGLVADIIARFEKRGFKLVGLKIRQPTKALLEEHYADLSDKPFFPKLIQYMSSGPVVCMVWEGADAVKTGRKMLGATNPLASEPGTIRGDYCLIVGRNICHGSDSVESANKEITLWFGKDELVAWKSHSHDWIYE